MSAINKLLFIATIITGIISWFIGNILYGSLVESMPRPLVIGIVFLSLYIILMVVVVVVSGISGTADNNGLFQNIFKNNNSNVVMNLLIGAVLVFILGIVFQWIYGLNFGAVNSKPTSYVFVIDDSGSMEGNDPSQQRYRAIEEILSDMPQDFPYMIYSFADGVNLVRDMAPVSAGINEINSNSKGGTSIRAALNQVIEDYQNGIWKDDQSPKVILLTDGYATDIGFFTSINGTLKNYVKEKISVSTVGLGSVDESLMNKIANKTGGIFVDISDASQIKDAISSAATHFSARDLLTTRYTTKWEPLYVIMHLLFIFILAVVISSMTAEAYGNADNVGYICSIALIKSVLGTLIAEFATNAMGMPGKLTWFLLWMLIAVTLAMKNAPKQNPIEMDGISKI